MGFTMDPRLPFFQKGIGEFALFKGKRSRATKGGVPPCQKGRRGSMVPKREAWVHDATRCQKLLWELLWGI